MTELTTKKQDKKPRQKRHDLGKLAAAFQEAAAIAAAADIQVDEVNLNRLNSSLVKATEDISSAIGVSASRLKVSVSLAGNTPAKRAA